MCLTPFFMLKIKIYSIIAENFSSFYYLCLLDFIEINKGRISARIVGLWQYRIIIGEL